MADDKKPAEERGKPKSPVIFVGYINGPNSSAGNAMARFMRTVYARPEDTIDHIAVEVVEGHGTTAAKDATIARLVDLIEQEIKCPNYPTCPKARHDKMRGLIREIADAGTGLRKVNNDLENLLRQMAAQRKEV